MRPTETSRIIIAVPARDEAAHLGDCLRALAFQQGGHKPEILVLVNNSTDASADIARSFAAQAPVRVTVHDVKLPAEQANAGHARRLAMELAVAQLGSKGVLMTTDADGRVAPDWLSANMRALDEGADAVAGRAELDPADAAAIPQALQEADALECAYAALLDQMEFQIDPDSVDAFPRHDEHSGASIAVTVPVFHRAGGVPAVLIGEDRAFFQALRRVDARIRHAPDVRVVVSGRIHGRAFGGMADTIRRRLVRPDRFLDSRLEPALERLRRLRLRRRARNVFSIGQLTGLWRPERLAADLGLAVDCLLPCVQQRYFGAAWEAIEAACPELRANPVAAEDVARQIRIARAILSRRAAVRRRSTHPAGIALPSGAACDEEIPRSLQ